MRIAQRNGLVLFLVAAAGCAVVDQLSTGFRSLGRWAEGLSKGEGEVQDGEQQGEWTFTTEDGQLRARGGYKDDVQDGPWVYWYPSGNKEYEGTFADSRRVGLWRYWHPSGTPRAQGYFEAGREQGEWIFWAASGSISQRGFFENGLQSGQWTYWSPSGSREAEGLFLDGERAGLWTYWDQQGQISKEWYELPEGHEYVADRWEDGGQRRAGFLVNGRQDGLWVLRHPDGPIRMVGSFENGSAHGAWTAFRPDGDRLASGRVELGRPSGTWQVNGPTGPSTWSADGSSPPPPFRGEWTPTGWSATTPLSTVLGTWIAECMAPIEDDVRMAASPLDADAQAPAPNQVAAAAEEPDVPVNAQPWTQRELEEYVDYVRAYEDGEVPAALASRYAGPGAAAAGTQGLSSGGDGDRGSAFLGKPLPLTVFKGQDGGDVDLGSLRGDKVILVVLRGFGGGLCVYCTAQTKAFCSEGAFERFEDLGAKLQVVFPGPKNGLAAFKRGYAALNEDELPPYSLLYENDYIVSQLMMLEGNKVTPSTFILDEEGIVRFAYIGKNDADRPAVKDVVQALEDMNAQR